jgi:hypothetical protein
MRVRLQTTDVAAVMKSPTKRNVPAQHCLAKRPPRQRLSYFNTTGVPVQGHIRTRPKIVGHARFNGVVGFDPNHPLSMINRVFECAAPCVWNGQNKVLFERMLPNPQQPDYFLVVVRAADVGRLDVSSSGWRSEGTLV